MKPSTFALRNLFARTVCCSRAQQRRDNVPFLSLVMHLVVLAYSQEAEVGAAVDLDVFSLRTLHSLIRSVIPPAAPGIGGGGGGGGGGPAMLAL